MSDVLHGLWEDLRDKRLWPVAALLAVALVAVPVVLLKPGGTGGGSPAAVAPAQPQGLPTPAQLAGDTSSGRSSDLGVFNPKDPFRPPGGFPSATAATGGGGGAVPTPAGVPSPSGGDGGATASSATGGSAGSSVSTGSAGAGPAHSSPAAKPAPRKTFTYVVDIRFGERGEVRSRKGVRRMALLPSARNPLLVFLGVSADRRSAIFLVDSGLSQAGEGTCKPSKRFCSFLYMRTADSRDDHFFATKEGKQYVLHLSKIRRVEVKRNNSTKHARVPQASGAAVGPGALFESPVFADEER